MHCLLIQFCPSKSSKIHTSIWVSETFKYQCKFSSHLHQITVVLTNFPATFRKKNFLDFSSLPFIDIMNLLDSTNQCKTCPSTETGSFQLRESALRVGYSLTRMAPKSFSRHYMHYFIVFCQRSKTECYPTV